MGPVSGVDWGGGGVNKSHLNARIEELEQLMRASGQLIPEPYADKRGQHVGIASVREIIAKRLRELLDERAGQ